MVNSGYNNQTMNNEIHFIYVKRKRMPNVTANDAAKEHLDSKAGNSSMLPDLNQHNEKFA